MEITLVPEVNFACYDHGGYDESVVQIDNTIFNAPHLICLPIIFIMYVATSWTFDIRKNSTSETF